jgi:UDP-N-acetylmuramyl pentapeptide synthase
MKSAIDLMSHFDRRRICVIGDMRELGELEIDLHREIGEYIRMNCDQLLTYGQLAVHYHGRHFKDHGTLINYLIDNLHGDEVILVKASRALEFEKIINELLRRI